MHDLLGHLIQTRTLYKIKLDFSRGLIAFWLQWWHRKCRNIAAVPAPRTVQNFIDSLLVHLVNTHNRVQRNIGALDRTEFLFQALLGRIHHYLGLFAKNDVRNFYESVHMTLGNFPGIEFIQLPLIVKL